MKKLILFLCLLTFGLSFSQEGERTVISGTISVPPGDDPEGILVMNTNSNRGTVSKDNGSFRLAVAVGDIISFSALQFQEFTISIDQNVIDSGELNVFVTEATTELPEVVVSSIDLSGNVRVDVNKIPVAEPNIPELSQEDVHDASLNLRPDRTTRPENAAMRDSFMEYGLNFANIFRAIFSARESEKDNFEPLDQELRQLYDDEFYKENLNIDRTRITEFILYAEENGLTNEMLEEGNELELIEFLIEQGENFHAESASDN